MIDTHQHLIHPERFRYPWLRAAPQLEHGHTLADYRPRARAAGITGSVFMEVDVAEPDQEAEARFFCELTGGAHGILGVIASGRPEHDDFADYLDRIAHPRLRGLRRVLHVVDDAVGQSAKFRSHVASLAERGLSFDLCVRAGQLPLALALAEAAPDTRLILDHGGNPPLGDADAMREWRDDVARLADQDQVACKISGLVNQVPAGADAFTALRPILGHLASCFGWQRLVFGGDWPVSELAGFDLPDWCALARRLVADQDQATQHAFFVDNAVRIYRLTPEHV